MNKNNYGNYKWQQKQQQQYTSKPDVLPVYREEKSAADKLEDIQRHFLHNGKFLKLKLSGLSNYDFNIACFDLLIEEYTTITVSIGSVKLASVGFLGGVMGLVSLDHSYKFYVKSVKYTYNSVELVELKESYMMLHRKNKINSVLDAS